MWKYGNMLFNPFNVKNGSLMFGLTLFLFYFILFDVVSLCNPGWSGTCYVDQAGVELKEILLPMPSEC